MRVSRPQIALLSVQNSYNKSYPRRGLAADSPRKVNCLRYQKYEYASRMRLQSHDSWSRICLRTTCSKTHTLTSKHSGGFTATSVAVAQQHWVLLLVDTIKVAFFPFQPSCIQGSDISEPH
ncbi:hypothetical protein K439DRAFT_774667 [Ramaria rubella]|nr:hypothetical protein K439DRAFT_774667 [Ramaria rubella]